MQQQPNLLDDVKSHFDHWRATRTKRGKIPEYLWDKVKLLIGHYSIGKIAATLNINTAQLRQHVNIETSKMAHFVEVCTDHESVSTANTQTNLKANHNTCTIELKHANGAILKITEFPVESLNHIITQFIG